MRSSWIIRRLAVVPVVALLFGFQSASAQKRGGAGAAPASPSTGSTSRGNLPSNSPTGIGNNTSSTNTSPARPIFLSGKVMFDDGSPTSNEIRIERVCGGSPHLESHTDSKGGFSFQVGQNPAAFTDASDTVSDPYSNRVGQFGPASSTVNSSPGGAINQTNPLWNCELRAAYPGFRSDTIDLSSRHSLDSSDVGTIVLHRLVNVQGSTISLTSELAPKQAQKAYQKGLHAAQSGKADDAEKDFEQATTLYPKYATAWFALGEMQQRAGKGDLAHKSYLASAAADEKYLSPFDKLALLAAQEGKWDQAADYSKHVIQLNPVEFPSSFWYNSLANYQLHKPADAEQSVTALLKLDTQHHFPEAENLMAQILLEKGKYPEAATHLRAYLALEPNTKNADALKAVLLKIDQASAQTKLPQTPPQ